MKDEVDMHNRILFSHKERSHVLCGKMDATGNTHGKPISRKNLFSSVFCGSKIFFSKMVHVMGKIK